MENKGIRLDSGRQYWTTLMPATRANQNFLDLHLLCRRRERCSKCIFSSQHCAKFPHLQNKISFQTNKGNVQKHRNIKICCDLSDLSVQPIDEICLFSVVTVYNTRWNVLMQSGNNMIIHQIVCFKSFKDQFNPRK